MAAFGRQSFACDQRPRATGSTHLRGFCWPKRGHSIFDFRMSCPPLALLHRLICLQELGWQCAAGLCHILRENLPRPETLGSMLREVKRVESSERGRLERR